MKKKLMFITSLVTCFVILFACNKEEITANSKNQTQSNNFSVIVDKKVVGNQETVGCVPPAYYANLVDKQKIMEETITYGTGGRYKAYARITYNMTPLASCPSKYYPEIIVSVECSRRTAFGNWVIDARDVTFSHGYNKNFPQIATCTSIPSGFTYDGVTFDGANMSKSANCSSFTYGQIFGLFDTNNFTDIFRLQNYWAHISISGGESGASIDFSAFI